MGADNKQTSNIEELDVNELIAELIPMFGMMYSFCWSVEAYKKNEPDFLFGVVIMSDSIQKMLNQLDSRFTAEQLALPLQSRLEPVQIEKDPNVFVPRFAKRLIGLIETLATRLQNFHAGTEGVGDGYAFHTDLLLLANLHLVEMRATLDLS
jgi:hypothetical protein